MARTKTTIVALVLALVHLGGTAKLGRPYCASGTERNYPDEEHCSKYWVCQDAVSYQSECEHNYLFDTEMETCYQPRDVECGARNCDGRPCKEQYSCEGKSDGFYPDPVNCIRYFECANGKVVKHHICEVDLDNGEQMEFDDSKGQCSAPKSVDCKVRPICDLSDENCHKDEETGNEEFVCPEDGYHPDPENCIKYYHCFENQVEEHITCPIENGIQEEYNAEGIRCDWPDRVNCGSRPVCDANNNNCHPDDSAVTTTKTPDPEDPDDFVCPEDGYFPDPKNCIKYYHCFNGQPEEHITCPKANGQQEQYNAEKIQCDWPDRVDCGNRPVCDSHDENCHPDEVTPITTTRRPSANCPPGYCSPEGMFMAEGDCTACFCECASAVWQELCCQPGLIFNPAVNQCDWPYNVNGC